LSVANGSKEDFLDCAGEDSLVCGGVTIKSVSGANSASSTSPSLIGSPSASDLGLGGKLDSTGLVLRSLLRLGRTSAEDDEDDEDDEDEVVDEEDEVVDEDDEDDDDDGGFLNIWALIRVIAAARVSSTLALGQRLLAKVTTA